MRIMDLAGIIVQNLHTDTDAFLKFSLGFILMDPFSMVAISQAGCHFWLIEQDFLTASEWCESTKGK